MVRQLQGTIKGLKMNQFKKKSDSEVLPKPNMMDEEKKPEETTEEEKPEEKEEEKETEETSEETKSE